MGTGWTVAIRRPRVDWLLCLQTGRLQGDSSTLVAWLHLPCFHPRCRRGIQSDADAERCKDFNFLVLDGPSGKEEGMNCDCDQYKSAD